ncbi:MAG: hypothetical protein DHS20C21_23490 [Gemmatimonadota bacterium]|nr:MAG: hypothetical protein DHS20C21_23490 [Gemmatimonadota bacterium]
MQEESLTLENGTLSYLTGGDGPLVVFSHALGPMAWGSLEQLRRSCTVAIPDWERSTVPPRTMAELDWFEPLVTATGFDVAALCAWSMAGPAAIYFGAEPPACLSHLILVDVAGLGPDLPPLRLSEIPHLLLTRLRGYPTRGLVRTMWRNWVHEDNIDTRPFEEPTYRFFRDVARNLEDPTGDDEDDDDEEELIDILPDVQVPTLVLSGRHSTVLGPRHGKIAAALLPDGTHVVFDRSSHTLQLEEADRFQETLAAFLTGGPLESADRNG